MKNTFLRRLVALLLAVCLLALTACSKAPTWQEQYDLGLRYLAEGNYQEAIIAFTAAIGIDEKRPEAFIGRGDAYLALAADDPAQYLGLAAADYETALGLDGSDPAVYERLADVYIQQGETQKAQDILQTGIDKTGDAGLQERLDEILEQIAAEEAANTGNVWPDGELPPLPEDGVERNVIEVATGEELDAMMDANMNGEVDYSNTVLRLTGDEYRCNGLWFSDCENLSIIGNGNTHIYSNWGSDTIFSAYHCDGLLLYGLVMGHELEPQEGCTAGVVAIDDSADVQIIACDIYGCGLIGLVIGTSEVDLQYTTVRDCSQNALRAYGATVRFDHCTVSGNGKTQPDNLLIVLGGTSEVSLVDCALLDNRNVAKAGAETWDSEAQRYTFGPAESATYTEADCYEDGNAW